MTGGSKPPPYGIYFSGFSICRQDKNLRTEILDKGHFTEVKYNQEIMRQRREQTMESGSSGNIPGRSSQTMVGWQDPNPNRFSGTCISQYCRKSLDNTQSIVFVIFFVLENADG